MYSSKYFLNETKYSPTTVMIRPDTFKLFRNESGAIYALDHILGYVSLKHTIAASGVMILHNTKKQSNHVPLDVGLDIYISSY